MQLYTLREKPDYWLELRHFLNRSLELDFITMHMLERCTVRDPNYSQDDVYLALEGGELKGLVIIAERTASPEELVEKHRDVLWIKALAIPKEQRGMGLFNKLMEAVFWEAEQRDKMEIRVADFASWYFHPGIDVNYEFYLQNYLKSGFTKIGDVVDYHLDLKCFNVPYRVIELERKLISQNYRFRHASKIGEVNLRSLTDFIKKKFSPCWAIEAEMALREPDGGLWIVFNGEDRLVGFAAYGALEPNWFGPVGVVNGERGKGIGTVLLYRALMSMRLNGVRYVKIPWTSHLFFYTQLSRICEVRHYWRLKLNFK